MLCWHTLPKPQRQLSRERSPVPLCSKKYCQSLSSRSCQKSGPVCLLLGELGELGEEVGRAGWDESLSPLFTSEQLLDDGPTVNFKYHLHHAPLYWSQSIGEGGCCLESVVTARLPLTPLWQAWNARPARSASQIFDVWSLGNLWIFPLSLLASRDVEIGDETETSWPPCPPWPASKASATSIGPICKAPNRLGKLSIMGSLWPIPVHTCLAFILSKKKLEVWEKISFIDWCALLRPSNMIRASQLTAI